MRKRVSLVAVAAALVLSGPSASAQTIPLDSVNVTDTTFRHSVRLQDGSTLIGRVLALTADSVRVQLSAGTVVMPRTAVAEVRQFAAARMRNGEYWFENPHATRLLFSSTAFPLEKGTGYYANTWIVLHTFAAGLTDRFTLGGGLFWFPGVSIDNTLMYLLPKYTVVDAERGKLAVGALVGILPLETLGDDGPWTAGILYGVGTTGSRDSNASLGLGWGYAGDKLASNPVVMLGGQARASRRLSLISENWIFPVDGRTEGVLSGGLRFLGEGLTVDLAYLKPLQGEGWAPWVGFAFRF